MSSKGFDRLLASLANLCSIATVLGAAYVALTTGNTPQLSYTVNPVRSVIGDPKRTARVEIQVGGRPATEKIMAAQILIFNGGKYPLDAKDFTADPLRIVTKPKIELIDATVQEATSQKATQFRVIADDSHLKAGEVPVVWSFMEENDAGVVQLIYQAQKVEVEFGLAGTIKGQRHFRNVLIDRESKLNEMRPRGVYLSILALVDLLLLAGTFYASVTRRTRLTIYYGVAFFCVTSAVAWVVAYIALTPFVPLRF